MAERARLTPPQPRPKDTWPWHTVECGSVSSSLFYVADRRLEAETYLSSGFGIRVAIEGKPSGWQRIADLADVWMPGRLKGIQVSPTHGTPFLAATQVFDVRPVPRKWLALARTHDAERRFVREGMILVTCSGSVGRPTLAYTPHEKILISHDLLRIEPKDPKDWGWLYAFLHSPQARAMAAGAQYGHIIKHLETSHVDELPIPKVPAATAARFEKDVSRILELRKAGFQLTLDAEARFEAAFGALKVPDWGEAGFRTKASATFLGGRRRFDAWAHNPGATRIRRHLKKGAKKGFSSVADAGYEAWLPNRFKRTTATDGVLLVESAALVRTNPDITKRIADGDFGDPHRGRVKPGWLLLARSGQIYGINGTAVLATEALSGHVISDDVIRVAPTEDCGLPVGYLWVALSHPTLGRPLVKALAYGSSIPHIDPGDFAALEVPRLDADEESAIADLAERAAASYSEADVLERKIAADAGEIVERFLGH